MPASCSYAPSFAWGNRYNLKHHQWTVLTRKHALKVAFGLTKEVMLQYKAVYVSEPLCSDEVLPILTLFDGAIPGHAGYTMLQQGEADKDTNFKRKHAGKGFAEILDAEGIEERCTTYTYWDNCFYNEKAIVNHFGFGSAPKKPSSTSK